VVEDRIVADMEEETGRVAEAEADEDANVAEEDERDKGRDVRGEETDGVDVDGEMCAVVVETERMDDVDDDDEEEEEEEAVGKRPLKNPRGVGPSD
jgi:hypothetical protein